MNTERVYIFPDTLPQEAVLFPLVQLFSQLVYLLPVEEDLPALSARLKAGRVAGLLQFHAPTPLGPEREGFLHLFREMCQRPSEFTQLSLAALSNLNPMESKQALCAAIQGKRKEADEQAQLLWQARLVLKLGEYMQQQEEEISQGFKRIQTREQALLADLQDRAAIETALPVSAPSKGLRQRCTAWKKLFSWVALPVPLLITSQPEAVDSFLEPQEDVQPCLTLPLPLPRAEEQDWLQKSSTFRQQTAHLSAAFMTTPSASARREWVQLLNQHYPPDQYGRCSLSFFPEHEGLTVGVLNI